MPYGYGRVIACPWVCSTKKTSVNVLPTGVMLAICYVRLYELCTTTRPSPQSSPGSIMHKGGPAWHCPPYFQRGHECIPSTLSISGALQRICPHGFHCTGRQHDMQDQRFLDRCLFRTWAVYSGPCVCFFGTGPFYVGLKVLGNRFIQDIVCFIPGLNVLFRTRGICCSGRWHFIPEKGQNP